MRRVVFVLAFSIAVAIASSAQTLSTVYSFCSQDHCNDGANPYSTLVQGSDGNFYGTANEGGTYGDGTVFNITPEGMLTTLYSFSDDNGDGIWPKAGLVQGTDGNFYGTAPIGGFYNDGTVFKITPEGTQTVLHNFNDYYDHDGASRNGLIQATDGNFYGTTYSGGANINGGTVFKITPEGSLTTLYSFCSQPPSCTDGNGPNEPVQATDGNFYGTTIGGGANGDGTVFKMTPQGVLTTLYSFNNTDGASPNAGLVQGTDGNFYGTTIGGGANGDGTVFKMTPQGTLTTLHSFDYVDGLFPYAELVQATNGDFYGTTSEGGGNDTCFQGCGTIFKITSTGVFTTLHVFDSTDGASPYGGLLQASDGSFYGTTAGGGAYLAGTVFRLPLVTLSVTKDGSGTITSGDGHIYCGSVCSYAYVDGTQVGLTAIPAPGYTFDGFTGCDNVNGDFCLMTMDSAKNVTATFTTSNVGLTSLVLNPTAVKGGNISIATISLNAPAPPGGLGVGVATNSPLAVHPPSMVVVPEGRTFYSFAVRTTPVRMTTMANIIASAGASQVNATLTVTTGYGSSQAPSSGPPR